MTPSASGLNRKQTHGTNNIFTLITPCFPDLGMLWYGVTGVSFNPADPAEVMLNTGTAAPLLSDHPRPLVPTPVSYSEPTTTQHTQMVSFMYFIYFIYLLFSSFFRF